MRICSLELLAYGPFRGLTLDLGAPGLHVVFGRNEAGKSTTLRAITGLLYGIDPRTPDAHLHKPTELRIGGVLAGEGGDRVRVVRRKGNANTLLDIEGRAIDETVLLRLLRGVGEETFRHSFGLDHDTLRSGAVALLEGKGDLGESLFDASVGGGGDVQRLLQELTAEADKIYKPRGSALPLNDALKAFTEAQRQIKEKQSLPEAYVTQQRALEELKARRAEEAKRRAELAADKARIDRARRRVPLERRRAALLEELAGLGEIVRHAARIKSIETRLAAYERASQDRRDLAAQADRLRDRHASAARRAGVAALSEPKDAKDADAKDAKDTHDVLRIDVRKETRIHKLVSERSALAHRIETAQAEMDRAARALARAREAASAAESAPDASAIETAVERARSLGDAETRHAQDLARITRRRKELEARASKLGLFEGTLEALVSARVPQVAAVERLASVAHEADRAVARTVERLAALDTDATLVERQIAEQSGDFAPPEAADLRAVRAERDEAFEKLRAASAKDRASLEAAFEHAVRRADEIADRMIREADRVTLLARLRASRATIAKQRDDASADRSRAEADRAALDEEHRRLFGPAAIVPRGFAEMRSWLDEHAQIVEAFERLRETEADADETRRAIEHAEKSLAAALGADAKEDARLADLVSVGKKKVEFALAATRDAAAAAREATALAVQIDERRAAMTIDEAALEDVRARLGELVSPLGIPEDASAEEVVRALEALRDVFVVGDELAAVEARAALAERDAASFEEAVTAAVSDLAPDLAALPTLEAASVLARRSQRAELASQELASIDAQRAELGDDALPEEIARLGAEPESAVRAIEALDAELDQLDRELQRLDQQIGAVASGLEHMKDDSGAAEASALAQEALARIRSNVERFARAKLASVLLSREIERYREENQGPLLSRASQLFARLTLGAFTGVRAGFDDRDRPALACVRAGGADVGVTGLSEGTRDQLYLSLRLASLLRYAEIGVPMPLVLDDVLIHFDDERSRAALAVLAEVAQSMQVLFFTHHARLVELARAAIPSGSLVVHELAQSPAAAVSAAATT